MASFLYVQQPSQRATLWKLVDQQNRGYVTLEEFFDVVDDAQILSRYAFLSPCITEYSILS